MRPFRFLACALGLWVGAHAAVPAPLDAALKRSSDDADRWAYTETQVSRDKTGKADEGETIVRFDPSQPFEAQFTPIKVDGHEPTEKERAKFRQQGIRRGEQLQREAEKAEGKEPAAAPTLNFNSKKFKLALENAKVVEEQGALLTYEIPLESIGKPPFPLERIRIRVRVNRDKTMVENVNVRVLEPFRIKVVAKVSRGDFSLDFIEVDPKYPPVMASLRVEYSASLLLLSHTGSVEERRTDFKRVKPYFDRFGVKIGPLKSLPL
jgi:hypothetical protein